MPAFFAVLCNVIHCLQKLPTKTDSSFICVRCTLEHVCYEQFSLQNCRFEIYFMLNLCTV